MTIVVDKNPLEFSRNFDILDNQRLKDFCLKFPTKPKFCYDQIVKFYRLQIYIFWCATSCPSGSHIILFC